MNLAWPMLIVAGLLEVGWAIGLKHTDGFNFRGKPLACVLTLAGMTSSMYLLSLAVRTIPIGTGYAIWTGIGALGAATIGMFILKNEPASAARVICLVMVVAGMIGLKLTSGADAAEPAAMPNDTVNFYIGGYNGDANKGVYRATLDRATGQISAPVLAVETKNPSFLAQHPTLPVLYAVSEVGDFEGKPVGAVKAFNIAADGSLAPLGARSTKGNGPCYVAVDAAGKLTFAANYGDGTVAAFPIAADGALGEANFDELHVGTGPDPKRQSGPHAHSFLPAPGGRFALSADLGTDSVFIYRTDNTTVTPAGEAKLPPGSGPRHIAFAVDGRFAYVVNELSNTVATFSWDAQAGTLTLTDVLSTLPARFTGNSSTAEIAVHPNGRLLYASNRGADSLAIFKVEPQTGKLTAAGHASTLGRGPRHFAIDPSGKFVIAANQKSDSLVVFRVDEQSGALTPTGSTVTVGAPACVRFVR